jgi:heat shock protein HslJ
LWGRIFLVTLVALAVACGNTDASNSTAETEVQENRPQEPTASAPATAGAGERTDLPGTRWSLTELEGRKPIEGTEITLTFQNGGLAGNAGCNSYNAPEVKLDEGTIETSTISATEMACGKTQGGVMSQEQRYLRALKGATSYRLAEDRLEMRNGAGEKILLFEKEKA